VTGTQVLALINGLELAKVNLDPVAVVVAGLRVAGTDEAASRRATANASIRCGQQLLLRGQGRKGREDEELLRAALEAAHAKGVTHGAGGKAMVTVSGMLMVAITSAALLRTTLPKPALVAAPLMAVMMLSAKLTSGVVRAYRSQAT
jgi:hypothetical protein